MYRLGIDVGGTFTDLVAFDHATGAVLYTKSPTTYDNFVDGIVACFEKVALEPRAVGLVNHGTTLVINALIQRNGARAALITSAGFPNAATTLAIVKVFPEPVTPMSV